MLTVLAVAAAAFTVLLGLLLREAHQHQRAPVDWDTRLHQDARHARHEIRRGLRLLERDVDQHRHHGRVA